MIDKYAKLLSSRLDDVLETYEAAKARVTDVASQALTEAKEDLSEIQEAVDRIESEIQLVLARVPKATNAGWTHAYVQVFVSLCERLPLGMSLVRVPQWYAYVMRMPDSAYTKGKTVGYHVGHLVAFGLPVAILGSVASLFV